MPAQPAAPAALDQLAEDYQEHRLRAMPTWAHMIGEYAYAERFDEIGRAAEARLSREARQFAARAEAIGDEELDEQRRITRKMIVRDASARAEQLAHPTAEFGADPVFGQQAGLPVRVPKLAIPDRTVAEAMTEKYRGVGAYFRDLAARHRDGVTNGRTPAEFAVHQTLAQLDRWLAVPLDQDPLLDTAAPPADVDADGFRDRLCQVVADEVRPALLTYRDVLRDVVAPHARPDERCGLSWLAGGDEMYASLAGYYTTTDLTPQEIHDIGLRQVASLAEEYRSLGPEALGTDDLGEILAAMRDDPALHHTDGDQIVEDSKTAMARARAVMADWFGRLPKADCDVEATTSGGIAYYFAPPRDGSRGGVFFMNVADPEGWGRFEIENTAFHEGIPGHHLQLAVAAELDELPEFRKRAFVTAYSEGWGLYTERLADEMGLYSTPLDRLGMLAADSTRACRLVVDTGMHALGWSRQRAIDYLVENSPTRVGPATAEIDRYAVMPGQALAYMIGRLEIQRIRREAEERQGDSFAIAEFHDAVLDSGPLPLAVLDEVVRRRLP